MSPILKEIKNVKIGWFRMEWVPSYSTPLH
jgi:hypothetical protein